MNESFEPLNAAPKGRGFFNLQEYTQTYFNRDFTDSNFFSRWTYQYASPFINKVRGQDMKIEDEDILNMNLGGPKNQAEASKVTEDDIQKFNDRLKAAEEAYKARGEEPDWY